MVSAAGEDVPESFWLLDTLHGKLVIVPDISPTL